MKINNEHVILFIVKKRLHPCLRCIRYKHDIKTPSKQNMVGLNELKRIFAFLLNDSLKIMDNNLSALIFMISSHTLVAKLIQWKFIDYSSLSGYPHQAKLQQMKIENKGANDDIGYIFECCLNDSNINKSIFNHNINIPRYIIIEYLHQCILYLTPYTFNVHELIHILLSNMYLPSLSPSNDHKFDSEFFTSYTISFRTISGNIHNINVPKIPETNTEECHKLRQAIAKNDILDSFISMKEQLEFEGHELLYIAYINALCSNVSTKKNIGLFKPASVIEAM